MSNAAHYPIAMKTATRNKVESSHEVVAFTAKRKAKKSGGKSQAQGGPNERKEYVTQTPNRVGRDDQINPQSRSERAANKRGFGHVFSGMIRNPTGQAAR